MLPTDHRDYLGSIVGKVKMTANFEAIIYWVRPVFRTPEMRVAA